MLFKSKKICTLFISFFAVSFGFQGLRPMDFMNFFGSPSESFLFAENVKFTGWKKAETEHFNFIYEDASLPSAQEYAKIADVAWNKVSKIYGFPQEKTNVYVTGRTDTVNAYTFFSPLEIMMFTSPVLTPDFTFREDWKKLFFTHELIHVANVDFEDKADGFWPIKLFGPALRSYDSYSGWALEGLTTVLETELTNGGRGRSPYFELMYKAPTLDNGFISYSDVGYDAEPPYGQSYVIGYLMMRSIADRWGINALADIERNRSYGQSWDEAVQFVTGETAEDIYRDVRISLAKKYKDERDIPEGLIISPRATGTFYYKPAIVLEDGTLITLRSANGEYAAAVKLDPSAIYGRNYIHKTKPKEDLNTVFRETILFTGSFSDHLALTADQNGNLYASLGNQRSDRMPGPEMEYSIYSWTEEKGLKKLTKGSSLFQPSVSRDGKTLVAVEQKGLKMRLVKVNTENGEITPLLENPDYDFIEPAVNADGTKLAFLCVGESSTGFCAKVCVMDLTRTLNAEQPDKCFYTNGFDDSGIIIVENGKARITDPAYPSWNTDGKLLFTNNVRGRLEVFEAEVQFATRHDSGDDDSDEFSTSPIPVVSDPIGALWAYKNERGIYYWSYASNGYVIKIKPNEEWGNIPGFKGPSLPGEIIHLGNLQRDYPDFKPYEIPSEEQIAIDRIKEKEDKSKSDNKASSKKGKSNYDNQNDTENQDESACDDQNAADEEKNTSETKEPTPVSPKEVARRPESLTKKSEENLPAITELKNERAYIPLPQPFLYLPVIWFDDFNFTKDLNFGFGGFFTALTPKLQMTYGLILVSGLYYPTINNFSTLVGAAIPIGHDTLDIIYERNLLGIEVAGTKVFMETNLFEIGNTLPFYKRTQHVNEINLSLITSADFNWTRFAQKTFSVADSVENLYYLNGQAGLEFLVTHKDKNDNIISFNLTGLAIGTYDFELNKFFIGAEAEFEFIGRYFNLCDYDFELCSRYTDFPTEQIIAKSRAWYSGEYKDCSYPGLLSVKLGIPTFFGKPYGEICFSYGKNSNGYATPENENFLNFTWNKTFALGYEYEFGYGVNKGALGIKYKINVEDADKSSFDLYASFKFDWLRN